MKVTFVALNYAPSRGGAQELVRRVAEQLVARGHEVDVITTDALRSPGAREPGRIELHHEVISGVSVHRYGVPRLVGSALRGMRLGVGSAGRLLRRPPRGTSPWLYGPWSPGLLRALHRALRTSDVVVGCTAPFLTLVAASWFGRGATAHRVALPLLHVSEAHPHPAASRALQRFDRAVLLTEFERGVAVDLGVPAAHAVVIPAGCDPASYPDQTPAEARSALGLPERPTVGFIGRLAGYKGIDTLLDAAQLLWKERPDTTVLLAGNPTGWDGYRSPALTEVAGDRLVVRERFADDERAALLAACDVVAHPSREESFGMVAVEAWAARRPIVVADIPAVRDVIEPGRTGDLVAPGDAVGLAEVLGTLLDHPEQRASQGAAGRALVEERYGWDRIGDAWDQLLGSLVDGRR